MQNQGKNKNNRKKQNLENVGIYDVMWNFRNMFRAKWGKKIYIYFQYLEKLKLN